MKKCKSVKVGKLNGVFWKNEIQLFSYSQKFKTRSHFNAYQKSYPLIWIGYPQVWIDRGVKVGEKALKLGSNCNQAVTLVEKRVTSGSKTEKGVKVEKALKL